MRCVEIENKAVVAIGAFSSCRCRLPTFRLVLLCAAVWQLIREESKGDPRRALLFSPPLITDMVPVSLLSSHSRFHVFFVTVDGGVEKARRSLLLMALLWTV